MPLKSGRREKGDFEGWVRFDGKGLPRSEAGYVCVKGEGRLVLLGDKNEVYNDRHANARVLAEDKTRGSKQRKGETSIK